MDLVSTVENYWRTESDCVRHMMRDRSTIRFTVRYRIGLVKTT